MKQWQKFMLISLFSVASMAGAEEFSESPRATLRISGFEGVAGAKDKWPAQISLTGVNQNLSNDFNVEKASKTAVSYTNTITVTKSIDAASPLFMKAAESHQAIKSVAIEVYAPGSKVVYALENAFVDNLMSNSYLDPNSGVASQESVTFSAKKMTVSVSKGSYQSSVTLLKQNAQPQP